ncbi:ATP-grasp domain-containing protein [Ornithinimicrobium sp. W1679]|uniref:ATP-grasp domain-containing protein n=1 Tax=Ornithinimicrobium sp. W1679 TaxID=3418770 RepID=UPI003CF20D81
MTTPTIYALHENPEWFPPFAEAFAAEGVHVEEWLLTDGVLDLDSTPPEGVFWSRISASAHTREHHLSKDYTRAVLSWLESHGRRTVNGRQVLELEMSKVDQLARLRAAGIETPRTVAAIGRQHVVQAAAEVQAPFVTKHNQGGKGLGVRKFDDHAELADYVPSEEFEEFEEPEDGITLIQEYVVPARPSITRVEIVGGEFIYAIEADTARGGFQLCPADACAIDPATGQPIMPPGATLAPEIGQQLFSLRDGFDHPIIEKYLAFARTNGIEVCGIEFIESVDGRILTYDVNTNTNYNAVVEQAAPRSAPRALVQYLRSVAESL